jgi:hypothetical protein
MDVRPTNVDEKLPVEPYDRQPSRDRKGANVSPDFRLFFKGVPMGLQPAFSPPMVMKNLQFRTVANRAATGKERYATAPFPSVFSTECQRPFEFRKFL